ncbi:MAG TPA: MerR family transcriptional regulator [Anaerolineales bacterium]|nr:MerR family transcriptional regulator [Anaerolineales bacterium]
MAYTIKEIAELGGVTTRTLRYYDEIGLLAPADTGGNGYRYYDQESLLRLQQILFFRELGVPLRDIQAMMSLPDFNLLEALENHRKALQARASRLDRLIDTVDQTIATLKGEWIMTAKDYFEGFDETRYADEVRERWGQTPQFAESQKKWAGFSKDQKEAIKAEGGRITLRMVGSDPNASPDDPDVQAAVGEYYAYLNRNFYTCDLEFLRGLSDMWVEDPRFAINYERIREGGAAFVREAVHTYCDRNG